MIAMLRLDERMIHGQVAVKWSRYTGVNRIVVASDQAASSVLTQKALMMAAPPTAKVAIRSVVGAINLLKDPRLADYKVMIIASIPIDVLTLAQNVPGIPLINVGNYGRIAPKKEGEIRKKYGENLYLYDEERELLKQVTETGIVCNYQTTPEDPSENLQSVLGS
ncbi:MAG: PTS system mannose/fructose/N-acetylgalactosamine-transporter subunit IIB [Lachnospiraceae bacterium]